MIIIQNLTSWMSINIAQKITHEINYPYAYLRQ